MLPAREEFPYAIRQVSEALGSNGSTSMGSVCASTLSMLNAGVPLKAPVAGIAMGLIAEGDEYVTLTDILGAEDAYGDMDFKVAGTKDFVTALQLDTKLDGIPASVLAAALQQARTARLTILGVMAEAIDRPDELSPNAPRVLTVTIPVDKIGEVIGPKGKVINQIQEDTGADITIEDDGTIYIGAMDGPSAEAARAAINAIANPQMPEVGERYLGTVVKTTNFGAFVSLTPGKDGLLHVSKMRALGGGKRVNNVEDVVSVGQKVQVEITEIDSRGKISLSPVEADERGARRREAGEQGVTETVWDGSGSMEGLTRRTVLPSGLRIVTEAVPGVRSVAFGAWVGVGSRDESRPEAAGASHFLEHLLFKGTARRSALDISVGMDEIGGEANAFTSKEFTCYYARVLDEDLPVAADIVCDLVTGSLLRQDDIDAERGVILEEIAQRDDDPGDAVHDLFAEAALGDSPLGRPILGTIDSIESMTRGVLLDHYGGYRMPQVVVTAAGRLDHDSVVRQVESSLAPVLAAAADAPPSGVRPACRGWAVGAAATGRALARDRAGQCRARRRRPGAARRATVRSGCALGGPGWRDELAAVPGDPGEARAGVLGVLVLGAVRRDRACSARTRAARPGGSRRCST